MRFTIFLLLSLLAYSRPMVSDDIDHWYIYYHSKKSRRYNFGSRDIITIKSADVKKTDSLTVRYYHEQPCDSCNSELVVEPEKNEILMRASGFGTAPALRLSIYDLLQYHKKKKLAYYDVFYSDKGPWTNTLKSLLFWIEFK